MLSNDEPPIINFLIFNMYTCTDNHISISGHRKSF
uniref:Uncharacterized protein n=1 Tax=Rhizophora mucronata TaxID=61149 RepID=A0A2P2QU61_RHIMU